MTAPYIAYKSPVAKTQLQRSAKTYIRWEDNLDEPVRIFLLKKGTRVLTVTDSALSSGVFQWTVPQTVATDTTYTLEIRSRWDSTLTAVGPAISVIDTLTSVASEELPKTFSLMQNYPNPFNPTTVISFSLPVTGQYSLIVYDLLGREVAVLMNENKPSGIFSVAWNATTFPSGVYFYRLQSATNTATRKLLLMK